MKINEELIRSCIAQNRDAQKQLYELLLPYLRAIASRYLRDTSYVKDVLQESYVKVFKNIGDYDLEKAPLKSWAAKITINNCINYNKRVIGIPKEEFVIEKHQGTIKPLVEIMSNEELLLLLKKMPARYYEVYNLFVIEGYSHKEIAAMLKINQALSRKRLSRGRTWVKNTFNKNQKWANQINSPSFFLN